MNDRRSPSTVSEPDGSPLPPATVGPTARISTVLEIINVPAPWLDRLIALGHELPYDRGEELVLATWVTEVERLVPTLRVAVRPPPKQRLGVSFPPSSGSPPVLQPGERHVLWTEPPKSNERLRASRVFADAAYERSVRLPWPEGVGAEVEGTLHFACDENVFQSDTSSHTQLLDRAAILVTQALLRVRSIERTAALEAETRAAHAQMVQAEKLASLGQIAAGMVHELNNPLTSIAAYTDFLLRRASARPGSDPDDVERLRRIAESANRMLRFTRDLVSYARPSGDVPIAVQLTTVIDRALAFCEHEIADASVTVERVYDEEVTSIRGLPEQLAQVFVNLVTNACHAMAQPTEGAPATLGAPHPAILTLSVGWEAAEPADRERVRVVVEDTGCGISGANLARIFTPFFTTKAPGRGTGLGLSIVKNIVDGHGGQIRAESDARTGTRFILVFPVERP